MCLFVIRSDQICNTTNDSLIIVKLDSVIWDACLYLTCVDSSRSGHVERLFGIIVVR